MIWSEKISKAVLFKKKSASISYTLPMPIFEKIADTLRYAN